MTTSVVPLPAEHRELHEEAWAITLRGGRLRRWDQVWREPTGRAVALAPGVDALARHSPGVPGGPSSPAARGMGTNRESNNGLIRRPKKWNPGKTGIPYVERQEADPDGQSTSNSSSSSSGSSSSASSSSDSTRQSSSKRPRMGPPTVYTSGSKADRVGVIEKVDYLSKDHDDSPDYSGKSPSWSVGSGCSESQITILSSDRDFLLHNLDRIVDLDGYDYSALVASTFATGWAIRCTTADDYIAFYGGSDGPTITFYSGYFALLSGFGSSATKVRASIMLHELVHLIDDQLLGLSDTMSVDGANGGEYHIGTTEWRATYVQARFLGASHCLAEILADTYVREYISYEYRDFTADHWTSTQLTEYVIGRYLRECDAGRITSAKLLLLLSSLDISTMVATMGLALTYFLVVLLTGSIL